ncbi:MAG: RNA polymerase sigma factor [Aquabacterium sp.]
MRMPQRPDGAPDADEVGDRLAAWAAGDRQALEPLYRRESGPVYRYLLMLAGDAAAAADATQEAFVALARRPQDYSADRGSLGAYLAGIGRHALLAHWRGQQRHEVLDEAALIDLPDSAPSPEAVLVRRQDQAALMQAVAALPALFREALVLVDLQERPYTEAARIAGCELNTLRTRLHRARQRLAALLNGAAAGDAP